jgi:hypothetical protein
MIAAVTTAKKLVLLAVLAVALVAPMSAQADSTIFNASIQLDVKACNGHTIHLAGQLLGVLTVTANSGGGFLFAIHSQPQGIDGTDLVTGTKYLATGLTRDLSFSSLSAANLFTFINRLHIQATTSAESYDVSQTVHLTANAGGAVTAVVDNSSATC